MRKLATGMRVKRGFTLIEILVVVLIIGITLGFALLAFGDFGSKRRILVAAEQLAQYIRFIEHQAILQSTTFGLNVNNEGYQVLRFTNKNTWEALPKKTMFHLRQFPRNTVVHFDNKMQNPNIIINSSGDMSSFKLNFSTEKKIDIASITGFHDGTVSFHYAKTS